MIGYALQLKDYIQGQRPKKAQSIPASLFWREEGIGIFTTTKNSVVSDDRDFATVAREINRRSVYKAMPFNLFISEKHKLSFKVSDHPLQDGSTISDHVHRELREVTIEGMFTNHPLKPLTEIKQVTFKDNYATSEVKSSVANTALANFNKLKLLANSRKTVRLVCSLEIYPKMVITSIDYERDAKSGSSIRFTMTLRELKTVSLKSVTGAYDFQPDELKTANDRMLAAQKKAGKRAAEEMSADELIQLFGQETI